MHSNKPKQYIQGWAEFYKLRFKVTPDVLIPRPETELLVDEIIMSLRGVLPKSGMTWQSITILDLGTGAGNIAISLAKNLPDTTSHLGGVTIIATDISEKALKVGRKNAKFHGVEDKIKFISSDLLSNVPRSEDICVIVTNLPYIPTQRISYLDPSVKDYEPHLSLDGGEDGFELYRKLFSQINEKGWKPNLIIGEIDYTHGELARNEALKYFPKAQVEIKTDLTHQQRILIIRF